MIRSRAIQAGLLLLLTATPLLAEESAEATHPLLKFIFSWLPVIVILVAWFIFMRRMGARKL